MDPSFDQKRKVLEMLNVQCWNFFLNCDSYRV